MATMNDAKLREKLKKIEILFSKSTFDGEKDAAIEAIKKIKNRLNKYEQQEKAVEYRFSIQERWSRQLFVALCRRYSLEPYRYCRQRVSSLIVKAPPGFINDVLSPEFQALNGALTMYLNEITEKIIREEIHGDVSEAKETHQITS